jgi:hypothetical protein
MNTHDYLLSTANAKAVDQWRSIPGKAVAAILRYVTILQDADLFQGKHQVANKCRTAKIGVFMRKDWRIEKGIYFALHNAITYWG